MLVNTSQRERQEELVREFFATEGPIEALGSGRYKVGFGENEVTIDLTAVNPQWFLYSAIQQAYHQGLKDGGNRKIDEINKALAKID